MKRGLYPKNWEEISRRIRLRSGGRCECVGECGLHSAKDTACPSCYQSRRDPDCARCHGTGRVRLERRCEERQGQFARFANGLVRLTVAHRDHNPANCADENLFAACQRCHLRYDSAQHRRNSAATRRAKKRNLDLPL